MNQTSFSLLALLLISTTAHSQSEETVRIMTWNVRNVSASSLPERSAHFARVFRNVNPHIVVTQENVDSPVENRFYATLPTEVTDNWGILYESGPDTDPACFYDGRKLRLVSQHYIATDLRNIAEYRFAVLNTRDTIRSFRRASCLRPGLSIRSDHGLICNGAALCSGLLHHCRQRWPALQ